MAVGVGWMARKAPLRRLLRLRSVFQAVAWQSANSAAGNEWRVSKTSLAAVRRL